jgi:hypothetical protein
MTSHFNLKPRELFCDWKKCNDYKKTVVSDESDAKCKACGKPLITDVSKFFVMDGIKDELGPTNS